MAADPPLLVGQSDRISLASVDYEFDRWSVQVFIPNEIAGMSGGTWMSSGPAGHSRGITVTGRSGDDLRALAREIERAAVRIDELS